MGADSGPMRAPCFLWVAAFALVAQAVVAEHGAPAVSSQKPATALEKQGALGSSASGKCPKNVDIKVSDFGCPDGDDPEKWLTAARVVKKDGKKGKAIHYHVPTNGKWTLKIQEDTGMNGLKPDLKMQKCVDDCCSNIEKKSERIVPTTALPMYRSKMGCLKKYHDGAFEKEKNAKITSDSQATMLWELKKQKCYAMATYIRMKVTDGPLGGPEKFFVTDDDKLFATGLHIRLLKMSVCKKVPKKASNSSEPMNGSPMTSEVGEGETFFWRRRKTTGESRRRKKGEETESRRRKKGGKDDDNSITKCANAKVTVSCWVLDDKKKRECTEVDQELAAAIVSRA